MRKRITVIGDLMIDIDHIVSDRDQREGRERLVVSETRQRLGAAGAVAAMVSKLGIDVMLVSSANVNDVAWIRRDSPGFSFIIGQQEPTTRRERFHTADWQIAGPRVDINGNAKLSEADQKTLAGKALGSAPDAIIVCDHGRGVVGAELMRLLRSSGTPVYVDPHSTSDFANFSGVECLSMNREESLAATAAEPAPKHVIIKMDADGLFWYRDGWLMAEEKPGEFESHRLYFPSMAGEIVDTLGAGDSFIATLAVGRLIGHEWEKAILFASAAAGLQCGRRGIQPIIWKEIRDALEPQDE